MMTDTPESVTLVPIDRIEVLNSRDRNMKVFEEIVENIRVIGLKKPITVTEREGADGVRATTACAAATWAFALVFPIIRLAEFTSGITLAVFALVCLALARIRARRTPAPEGTFLVYRWVPITGALACLGLLLSGLMSEL